MGVISRIWPLRNCRRFLSSLPSNRSRTLCYRNCIHKYTRERVYLKCYLFVFLQVWHMKITQPPNHTFYIHWWITWLACTCTILMTLSAEYMAEWTQEEKDPHIARWLAWLDKLTRPIQKTGDALKKRRKPSQLLAKIQTRRRITIGEKGMRNYVED